MAMLNREELDVLLAGVAPADGSALVHEAALAAWGLDNNVTPLAIDVLVPPKAFETLAEQPEGQLCELKGNRYLLFKERGIPVRAWRSVGNGVKYDLRRLVTCSKVGRRCLRPELVLEALPTSPDFPYLYEQRAALAEVLYFDDMTDEQLMEFRRYVRCV